MSTITDQMVGVLRRIADQHGATYDYDDSEMLNDCREWARNAITAYDAAQRHEAMHRRSQLPVHRPGEHG